MRQRLYTRDHTWVLADGDTAKVGLSDFAQGELGEVAFVELPEVGRVVSQGEAVCAVDSLKSTSEIYAPVSGTVVEVNRMLEQEGRAAQINRDPLGEGWLFTLRVGDPRQLAELMDSERYILYLKQG